MENRDGQVKKNPYLNSERGSRPAPRNRTPVPARNDGRTAPRNRTPVPARNDGRMAPQNRTPVPARNDGRTAPQNRAPMNARSGDRTMPESGSRQAPGNRTHVNGRSGGRTMPESGSRQAPGNRTPVPARSGGNSSANSSNSPASIRRRSEVREKQKKRRKLWTSLIAAAVAVVLIFVGTILVLRSSVNSIVGDRDFPDNLKVAGVELGGMTREDAVTALTDNLTRLGNVKFSFDTLGEKTDITLNDLGFSYKGKTGEEMVSEVYSYVHDGSLFTRYKNLHKLKSQTIDMPADYQLNEEIAAETLQNRCVIADGAARDAGFEHRGDSFRIRKSKTGTLVDTEATISQINEILGENWNHEGSAITTATKVGEPAITTNSLMDMRDCLGSYSTEFATGNEGRKTNVSNAVRLLDGHIVQPGEEFQCNPVMEPYTIENGYMEAGSFEEGEVVQSMGGGICQASSTLYNAILYAELEVTWRAPHSMMVHYVDPGRDAAIADDVKDLHFVNNTGNPIYICGFVEGNKVTFAIMGKEYRDPDRRVDYTFNLEEVANYRTVYQLSEEYSYGVTEQLSYGYEGGKYTLYKDIYENDELVDSEFVTQSEYSPANTIIAVGYAGATDSQYNVLAAQVEEWNEASLRELEALDAAPSGGY